MADQNDSDDAGGENRQQTGGIERQADSPGPGVSRRAILNGLTATGAFGALSSGVAADVVVGESATSKGEWEKKEPQLETPWTSEVGPENARPEYPRPQLVREEWRNLNGVWQFAGAAEGESPPIGEDLDERILVPYPVESGLSGIKRHETWMWYRRQFEVPNEWLVPTAHPGNGVENNPNAQRLLLHFERVDWDATVYVNGEKVTRHKGGYDHFVADVTDALVEDGPQELVVGVYDPTGFSTGPYEEQPIGRQGVTNGPIGLWKSPASGIWDTVWMEPVTESYIEDLEMTPDLDEDVLRLTANASADDATVVATAYDENDEQVGRVVGPANEELELPVPDPHLWSPDDPFLYDLDVKLRRTDGPGRVRTAGGGKLLDHVESYFGMRSLGLRKVNGTARPTLNGELIYHAGSLDSGYWPDGIYTAPTDEAQRYQIEAQKDLGFNMVRVHSKFETRRFFYHTDQLGLLVWQDIPNMDGYAPPKDREAIEQFKDETRRMITENDTHPSIAVWTPFNEGWGINNVNYVEEVVAMAEELDPERYINGDSGYNLASVPTSGLGQVNDWHLYPGPGAPPVAESDRFSANGEYTTPVLHFPDHTVGQCGSDISPEEFVKLYTDSVEELRNLTVGRGLSASVYTATTDLKGVCNGHITYDREVIKAAEAENGMEDVRQAHEALLGVMGTVVIDVEAPDTYDAGSLLGTATPFDVTVTITNPESADDTPIENVSAALEGSLPEGWTSTATTSTAIDAIQTGESATVTWEVTPDPTADGEVTLESVVDYEVNDESHQYAETQTVSAAQLAYWRMEDSVTDSSSFDNSLTLQNGASFDASVAAEGSYSLSLDGNGSHAMISAFGDGGILHGRFEQRTVSMWVNPDTTSGDQVLFNEGGYVNGMGLRIKNGSLEAIVKNNNDGQTTAAPFDHTEWTHVAVVFDRGALRLYVNGEEVAANEDVGYHFVPGHVAGSELGGNATSTPWAYGNGASPFFRGHIDATGIYRSALSPAEIEAVGSRSFSVDAPAFYATGNETEAFTIDATFSDLPGEGGASFENISMAVTDLPAGWTSEAQTKLDFDSVADGESVSATWEVTPDASTNGEVELEVALEYEADDELRRLVDGATLNTLTSASLAEWRFNGTTEDSSDNGHAATLENGATFDSGVAVEGSHSIALDGTDDFVNLADGGQPFLSQSFSERTVSLWVNPDSTAGSQVLYNQGGAVNGMGVRINEGTLEARAINARNGPVVSVPFDRTDWTHVAAVFDRGALRLYVDGEEVAANEDVGFNSIGSAYFGGELGGAEAFPWNGSLDGHLDVSAIYPFALSPELVSTLAGSY